MSQRTRYTLIVLGLNLLAGAILITPLFFLQTNDGAIYWGLFLLIFAALSLAVQLIVGIIFAIGTRRRALGQSMLLAVGIILLMGFSVCGTMLAGL